MNRNSPPEARLQNRFREATRTAILDAAEVAFARSGLASARMDEIASEAGVAVGTVYNYFADRDALLASVLESRRAELTSRLDGALASTAGRTFAERLEALIAATLTHFDLHRELFEVLLQADAHAGARPGGLEALTERVEKLVRAGVKEGALRKADADLHPALVVGALRGMKLRALHGREKEPLAADAGRLTRLLLEGMGS
jgi:AcrR family transcriptional regulator